jgi:anaerobic magnesium-protoporphyrin IX monomethyl ester cyclase
MKLNKKNLNDVRVALVSPRAVASKNMIRRVQPPLGLCCIAAGVRDQGFKDVLIYDALIEDYDDVRSLESGEDMITYGASNEKIIEKLQEFKPDIVGVSSLFSSQVSQAYAVARAVKKYNKNTIVVFGGIHASDKPEEVLNDEHSVDFVMRGEGDYTWSTFIEKIYEGEKKLNEVPGLIRRDGKNFIKNPMAPLIHDMDALPMPAWDLVPMEKYFEIAMYHNPYVKSGRVGCIMTSRGCPDKCYFCASTVFFGHKFRQMSPERVGEMVDYLVEKFQIKELQIEDDNFAVNPVRVNKICERIKHHKLRVTMPNAMRADTPLNREKRLEMFKNMREAGWDQIGLGVECGDPEFLNETIGKRLDLDEVVATCDLAHKAGLLVHTNFMMGFPFETKKTRDRTINFATKLDSDSYSLSLATPLPGTKMWDIVEKNNLFHESYNFDTGLPTLVSIKPHDISDVELKTLVENTNKKLNYKASQKRQAVRDKYKLLKSSVHGDRKYMDPSSASIEIDKEIIPMKKILSNEGTHGTENRGPARTEIIDK